MNVNDYTKYFRTMHVPHSPGTQSDDRLLKTLDHLLGEDVVIGEKMDGEGTSLYGDYYMHARSIVSGHHESRAWVKAFHGTFAHLIPAGWRICGENMFAKHSVFYENLQSYFYAFSVWNERNERLHWDDQQKFLDSIGVLVVPELYRGPLTMKVLADIEASLDIEKQEGYVITTVKGYPYKASGKHIAKWVRKGHVQTDEHWMTQAVVPNKLA